MSLAIAVKAADGVVLLADSRTTASIDGMNYRRDDVPKIIRVGQHPVALVGEIELLEPVIIGAGIACNPFQGENTFSRDCNLIGESLRASFTNIYGSFDQGLKSMPGYQTAGIFVGHGKYGDEEGSFIYQVEPQTYFGPRWKNGIALAGQHIHGGAYYLCRFLEPKMKIREAAYLAYFCMREVNSLDGTVGGGIHIWSVQNNKAHDFTEEWQGEFSKRHALAVESMRNWFKPQASLGEVG